MDSKAKQDTQKRLTQAEEDLKLVNDKIKEIEERDKAALEEMHEKLSGEIQHKMSQIQDSFRTNFDSRMTDIGNRYSSHIKTQAASKSHDVLRANRVIREVSRELGADWKFIFKYLMTTFDKAEVDAEIERIEKHYKPFLQPYEALNIWRELKADAFDIQQLITALRDHALHELADKAVHILQMDSDSLMSIGNIGGGFKSSRAAKPGEKGEGQVANGESNNNYAGFSEIIPDKTLLQLSKKISSTWVDVGRHLGVEDEEMDNITRIEGDSYHGAFKMLFSWRSSAPYSEEAVKILCTALKKAGHGELVSIVKPPEQKK